MTVPNASRRTRVGVFELVTAMVLSGTIGLFVVESGADPGTVVFFRCLFGAAALVLYCAFRGYFHDTGLTVATTALAVLVGVLVVSNWTLLFAAYERTSISVATVVYHVQPFVVLILGSLAFRERLSAEKWLFMGIAFGGVVLVSGLADSELVGDGRYLIGIGYSLVAAVLYGVATILAKTLSGVRPHIIALIQCLAGIPLLAPFVTYGELDSLGSGWWWLIGLGVIQTCFMYILIYSSYQKLPTSLIAILSFVYPAAAIVVDTVYFGTRISPLQVLGIALIVGASLASTFDVGRRRRAPVAPNRSADDREDTLCGATSGEGES